MDSSDPTHWVDDWAIDGLTPNHRKRIKAELLKAHAALYRADPNDAYFFIAPMRMAFDGVANILFQAQVLTADILNNDLRLLMLDFPARFGHRADRVDLMQDWAGFFASETAEWQARLLEAEAAVIDEAANTPMTTGRPLTHEAVSTLEGRNTERRILRDFYFASFSEKVIVLDMCWAAKQRYREWMRWIGGTLRDGSKPDRAFRAVLTSGKRPEEYRPSEPRPKGWK